MTEDQIDRAAEDKLDHLNQRYIECEMTDAEYHAAVRDLSRWAEQQLSA